MVESTAGIGEAGALINRAKAPATMDITRGIQMAESSALKKAQLEAAKEAKKQALEERMSKYARTNFGKFKNVGVAKEAKEKALELFSKKKMALESGNYDLENELDIETDYLGNYLASKDNAISELKSSKKYDYANKVGELINSGKEEEANKFSKPYAPVFVRSEMGDYNILAPDKVDLNKKYSSLIKDYGKNLIEYKESADPDNYFLSRKMRPEEIDAATANFLRDPENFKSTVYSPDFQKFYDENPKYKGSPEEQNVAAGVVDYTKKRLELLNQEKLSPKAKSKGDSDNYELTGDGYNLGKYSFTILNVPTSELVEKFKQGKDETMYGTNRRDSETFMNSLSKQAVNGVKVSMPANETKTFILDDPLVGNSIEAVPLSIYVAGNKKSGYLIYKDKNTDINQIVPLNSELVARLSSYYKVNSQDFINANKRKGIDLTKYSPDGSVNIEKGGSTPPPVQGGGKAEKPKTEENNFKGIPKGGF